MMDSEYDSDRFPTEIYIEIFRIFVEDSFNSSLLDRSRGHIPSQFILSAVCSRWRDIALATAEIWKYVEINAYTLQDSEIKLYTERTNRWLMLSGQHPLDIYLTFKHGFDDDDDYIIVGRKTIEDQLFRPFKQQSHRWRRLALQCHPSLCGLLLNNLDNASRLEDLRINATCDVNPYSDDFYICLNQPPNLRLLKISELFLSHVLDLGWDSITDLEFKVISVDEALEVLRLACRLVKCKFVELVAECSDFPMPTATLVHQSLTEFHLRPEIYSAGSTLQADFLDLVEFPSLTRLVYDIDVEKSSIVFPIDTVKTLLLRSRCNLTDLEIIVYHSDALPEAEVVQLLHKIPTLKNLNILCTKNALAGIADILLAHLTLNPAFLLDLNYLSFTGEQSFSWFHLFKLLSIYDRAMNCGPHEKRRPKLRINFFISGVSLENFNQTIIDRWIELEPILGAELKINNGGKNVNLVDFFSQKLDELTL